MILLKYSLAGAVVSGGLAAAKTTIQQKKISANPDTFIKKVEGEIEKRKGFHNAFFDGTEEAAKIARDKLDEIFKEFKEFASSGKLNFKAIAKNTGIAAAVGGVIVGGLCLLCNSGKKEYRDNSRIMAEEFKNAKVGEN